MADRNDNPIDIISIDVIIANFTRLHPLVIYNMLQEYNRIFDTNLTNPEKILLQNANTRQLLWRLVVQMWQRLDIEGGGLGLLPNQFQVPVINDPPPTLLEQLNIIIDRRRDIKYQIYPVVLHTLIQLYPNHITRDEQDRLAVIENGLAIIENGQVVGDIEETYFNLFTQIKNRIEAIGPGAAVARKRKNTRRNKMRKSRKTRSRKL